MTESQAAWGRLFRPSLTTWLWLTLLVVLSTEPWRVAMVSADGDTCMHWACGEWMLRHRQLLDRDVFSYTHVGQPIISKEWLAQLLFALVARWDGLAGIALLAASILATTFAALHAQLLRDGNELIVATAVTLLAMWASVTHWIARPHLFTLLLMVWWNHELRCAPSWRWYVVLPVLMMLWVNLHGGFLAGFITLGCYWLGAALERDWQRWRACTVAGIVSGLVSLLNPSGYRLHLHNFEFVRNRFLPIGWPNMPRPIFTIRRMPGSYCYYWHSGAHWHSPRISGDQLRSC